MSPPETKPEEESTEETDAVAEGDVDALLALAKTRRAAKDLKGCYDAYKSAADLGSMEAEYAVALFTLTGGVVPQDLKEGTMRLRSAADKGSIPAKVYLGNLYELGIHYKADPEKADVWYRNAARAARIEAEPGTEEHTRALAELGCVRHVLALPEEEKAALLPRAKAHGYGLKVKDAAAIDAGGSGDRPTFVAAMDVAENAADARERKNTAPETKMARVKAEEATKQRAADTIPPATKKKDAANASRTNVSDGLAGFGYAMLFAVAGVGAAYAATLGAKELVAHGTPLPGLGTRTDLVFPIVLALLGVLPAWLVYKFSAWAKALVAAAVMGGVGWVAWGTGQAIHSNRALQAIAFGLAGFLAGLLVLGMMGGTKLKAPTARKKTLS